MVYWIMLMIGLLGLDQLTKYLVLQNFSHQGESVTVIPGFFDFTYVRNDGAVFGLGGGNDVSTYLFVIAAVIALALFAVFFVRANFRDKREIWYILSLSLLIPGTLGNLIDRLFQPDHAVIDFFDFYAIWDYVFNVADICLTVGIVIFVFDQLILEPKRAGNDA